MRAGRGRRLLARYGAPLAFLAAATAAVLLVRAGLHRPAAARPQVPARAASALASRPVSRSGKPVHKRFHVIRAGDTLGEVAGRAGTTVERLLALNPGVEPTSLRIGQKIRTR